MRPDYKINYNIETPMLNNFIIIQISDKAYFENELSANRIERGRNSENKATDFQLRQIRALKFEVFRNINADVGSLHPK
jgi:hypothetical protein